MNIIPGLLSFPLSFLLSLIQSASLWVRMASTLSSDACNFPEFMLNIGSPVPIALQKIINFNNTILSISLKEGKKVTKLAQSVLEEHNLPSNQTVNQIQETSQQMSYFESEIHHHHPNMWWASISTQWHASENCVPHQPALFISV